MITAIDALMEAIRSQESGSRTDPLQTNADTKKFGPWQIKPERWSELLANAGLPPNAPKNYETEELAVRADLERALKRYGNLADAAASWYSGGPLNPASAGNPPDDVKRYGGYPSVRKYVDSVMAKTGENLGDQVGGIYVSEGQPNGQSTTSTETTPRVTPPRSSSGPTVDPNTLSAFMDAIRSQESNSGSDPTLTNEIGAFGPWQFNPKYWDYFVAINGFEPGLRRNLENQQLVARAEMARKYQLYGNWRDVAAAWYSGQPYDPDTADLAQDGGPTIHQYTDSVNGFFGANLAKRDPVGGIYLPPESAAPQSRPGATRESSMRYGSIGAGLDSVGASPADALSQAPAGGQPPQRTAAPAERASLQRAARPAAKCQPVDRARRSSDATPVWARPEPSLRRVRPERPQHLGSVTGAAIRAWERARGLLRLGRPARHPSADLLRPQLVAHPRRQAPRPGTRRSRTC